MLIRVLLLAGFRKKNKDTLGFYLRFF